MISIGNIPISEDYILSRVSELKILSFYFGVLTVPSLINSPLRKDKNPSFGIYYRNHSIRYKDFATGEKGNLFNLLMEKYHISYKEVLVMIYNDMLVSYSNGNCITKKSYPKRTKVSKTIDIKVRIRKWNEVDINYWTNKYGLPLDYLEKCYVYPIDMVFIYTKEGTYPYYTDKLAYVYIENKDNKVSYKIYQPYNKYQKWINKQNCSVWELWHTLPEKGNKLIITSSRKDAMVISYYTNIPSISLQAESVIPKKKVIKELKKRFSEIYILYDNDFNGVKNWGRLHGNKLSEIYDIPQIEIPDHLKVKDSSDLYEVHGKDVLCKTINELINIAKLNLNLKSKNNENN